MQVLGSTKARHQPSTPTGANILPSQTFGESRKPFSSVSHSAPWGVEQNISNMARKRLVSPRPEASSTRASGEPKRSVITPREAGLRTKLRWTILALVFVHAAIIIYRRTANSARGRSTSSSDGHSPVVLGSCNLTSVVRSGGNSATSIIARAARLEQQAKRRKDSIRQRNFGVDQASGGGHSIVFLQQYVLQKLTIRIKPSRSDCSTKHDEIFSHPFEDLAMGALVRYPDPDLDPDPDPS